MKIGIKDIISSKKYGMPAEHIAALQKVAATQDTPIAVRPVSPLAEYYLQQGCATKGYSIKTKTSDRGVTAGLIPLAPQFGRALFSECANQEQRSLLLNSLNVSSPHSITKAQLHQLLANPKTKFLYHKETDVELIGENKGEENISLHAKWNDTTQLFDLLATEDAQYLSSLEKNIKEHSLLSAEALTLTEKRLSELSLLLGTQLHITACDRNKNYLLSWKRGGELVRAYALWDEEKSIYHIKDEHKKPVLVLAKNVNGTVRYVTTDYDLLVICPHYKSFEPGGTDKTPFRTQGTDAAKNRLEVTKSLKEGYTGPREDEHRGNISYRTMKTIEAINKEIGLIDVKRSSLGLETVHHNAEIHNPFAADLTKSIPALMVFPRPMNLTSLAQDLGEANISALEDVSEVLIETTEELTMLREFLYIQGYHWPAHARYNNYIAPFRRESVSASQEAILKTQQMKGQLKVLQAASNCSAEHKIENHDELGSSAGIQSH